MNQNTTDPNTVVINTLTNLNKLLTTLQTHAATIGLTVALLLVAVYSTAIMLSNDNSPAGRAERWGKLRTVFICAAIIGGAGVFVQLATSVGQIL